MIKVGFTLIGRGNWSGGETYLRNMLGVIASELSGKVEAYLFVSKEQAEKIGPSFDGLLAEPPIVSSAFEDRGRTARMIGAMITGSDKRAAAEFATRNIDLVFESAHFYGWNFPIPILSWIPDFQHRRLPHYFSRALWWKRDVGFHLQTRTKRIIMLSSYDAEKDCLEFYPSAKGKTSVVRFTVDVDPAFEMKRSEDIRSRYELPARYFYLPNQFWAHKNHQVVVDALKIIKANGELDDVPPIIMTGRKEDPRNPNIFENLMANAKSAGVESHFKYFGLIPYADVFGLNVFADALINPSTFEGWSTPVEEAKALGTRMILSDISLHKEQASDALFFEVGNPKSLAQAIVRTQKSGTYERKAAAELVSKNLQRRQNYADSLLDAFKRTLSLTAK